jgi:hypothetical protein
VAGLGPRHLSTMVGVVRRVPARVRRATNRFGWFMGEAGNISAPRLDRNPVCRQAPPKTPGALPQSAPTD